MKYFLHDSSAFEDEKLTELFIEFGYEGLGLFFTILEKLAKQEKPVKTTVLKSQLKVGKRLEKHWKFMEAIDLISSNNGETFNKQLLNFSGKYKIKSEKNVKRATEWRNNQRQTENVTHNEPVCNTHKVNISKVNRNKENEEYIYSSFYDFEIKELEENTTNELLKSDYSNFIKVLFGENELQKPLNDILSMPDQLGFTDFVKLQEKAFVNNLSLREILIKIDNDPKYTKGKKSLYTTLLKWVSTNFDQNNKNESTTAYNQRIVKEMRSKELRDKIVSFI